MRPWSYVTCFTLGTTDIYEADIKTKLGELLIKHVIKRCLKKVRPLTEIIQKEIIIDVRHSVMWALIHPTIRLSENTPLAMLLLICLEVTVCARATVTFKGSP